MQKEADGLFEAMHNATLFLLGHVARTGTGDSADQAATHKENLEAAKKRFDLASEPPAAESESVPA